MPRSITLVSICTLVITWRSAPGVPPTMDAAVPRGEPGVERVHGAPAGGELIGMAGLQGEAAEAVVEEHAGVAGDEAGTEAGEDALDEADGVAVRVHRAEIGSVAAGGELARRAELAGAVAIDQAGALGCVLFGDEAGDGDVDVARIAEMLEAVFIGELLRLGHQVDAACGVAIRHVEGLDHVE